MKSLMEVIEDIKKLEYVSEGQFQMAIKDTFMGYKPAKEIFVNKSSANKTYIVDVSTKSLKYYGLIVDVNWEKLKVEDVYLTGINKRLYDYISTKIAKNAFDEFGQLCINFDGIAELEEVQEIAEEMGYKATDFCDLVADDSGDIWLIKEK